MLWVFAFIVRLYFPEHSRSELNNDLQEHLLEESELQKPRMVSISTLLKIPRFTLAALAGSLTYFTYSFMEPILAIRLNDFSLSQIRRGLFFAVLPCFYIPASLMIQYVPSQVKKRAIIISSMTGLFAAFLFVGPSQVSKG